MHSCYVSKASSRDLKSIAFRVSKCQQIFSISGIITVNNGQIRPQFIAPGLLQTYHL